MKKYFIVPFLVLSHAIQVYAGSQCVGYLQALPASRDYVRVQWNIQFDQVMRMFIAELGPGQLSYGFVRSLSKEDLSFFSTRLGKSISGDNILTQAKKRYGTWYKALEAYGIDTQPLTTRQHLSSEQIIQLVENLKNKENLVPENIVKMVVLDTQVLLSENGFKITGSSLYRQALDLFGSWETVLHRAGIASEDIQRISEQTKSFVLLNPKERIATHQLKDMLSVLYFDKGLSRVEIKNLSSAEMAKLLPQYTNAISGEAFVVRLIRAFGSVENALKDLGLRFEAERHIDLHQTIEALYQRFGDRVASHAFVRTLDKKDLFFLRSEIKNEIGGRGLLNYIKETHGITWAEAVKRYNDVARKIKTTSTLNETTVVELLKVLETKYSIQARALKDLGRDEIYDATGFNITGRVLYSFVTEKLGRSWYEFLEQNGFQNVIKGQRKNALDDAQIIAIIQELAATRPLNYSYVASLKSSDLNSLQIQRMISGSVLLMRASQTFGSWDQALIAAGLNPDVIRKKGWTRFADLPLELQQARREWFSEQLQEKPLAFDQEGQRIAVERNSAEHLLLEKERRVYIEEALENLSEKEQMIFDHLVRVIKTEEILPSNKESFMEILFRHTIENNNMEITRLELESLILKISQNEKLQELFH